MKKYLSLFLCLILLFGLLPLTAPARAASSEDWNYDIFDGKASIYGYFGSGGDVTIPSTLGGLPVTVITNYAFWCCTNVTGLTIPNSVTSIGGGAFSGCTGLTSVIIPDSVTSIGGDAFSGCTGLTSVIIPDSVTSIGVDAFSGCTGLTSVTIPKNVTNIAYDVFSGCTGLTSVTIPNSVTSIYSRAFNGCTSLTDVYYGGTEEDWEKIFIDYDNDPLTSATIHYAGPW